SVNAGMTLDMNANFLFLWNDFTPDASQNRNQMASSKWGKTEDPGIHKASLDTFVQFSVNSWIVFQKLIKDYPVN
ncbi:MAG: hypothetical protein ACMG6H_01655, partial [Acidobacteriota bacterium]